MPYWHLWINLQSMRESQHFVQHSVVRASGGGRREGVLIAGFNNSGSLLSFLVNFSMFWLRELILLSIRPEIWVWWLSKVYYLFQIFLFEVPRGFCSRDQSRLALYGTLDYNSMCSNLRSYSNHTHNILLTWTKCWGISLSDAAHFGGLYFWSSDSLLTLRTMFLLISLATYSRISYITSSFR